MFKQPFKNNKSSLNGLQHIQQSLHQQKTLLRLVQRSITEDLAAHCLHVTASKNTVILFTDSSVWASKLLYLRQPILNALSNYFGERVRTLKVKVLSKHTAKTPLLPKSPSSHTLKCLTEANDSEQADSLTHSMNKLIKTLQKNKLS
ncbi:MAG: hypothetical protein ACJA2Y_000877 [Cycloclasticus pugetii]|jgi:hypothetical protein|uniref:DUF721 domain-containing protein n=1 Tax=Cycloclasticus pugetii TaxID=34068 RepID=A0AB33YZA3_9GAMM|nr:MULTISPECIES: DciA family protein [Cycloclasticus]ATI04010.1 DUF721 domain-containing protein [Cycloclasticus sp. PY97N]EPD12229.1 hypothetical protein L196_10504 [Cycloclasticus pugetii]PHR51616.1 MAG: DUF721 domain-containing protein [Cycloclasticus sp.]SHJ54822.1 Protein of unknown function [Cycloclasticus pugetii]|tara:strand:+ start:227 stop:667 length:441 start_codon:yes stop_codon:yes gene_type:complete